MTLKYSNLENVSRFSNFGVKLYCPFPIIKLYGRSCIIIREADYVAYHGLKVNADFFSIIIVFCQIREKKLKE